MESLKTSRGLNLVAVFVVCWLIATIATAILCNFDVYYEPRPNYRVIKDEASLPMRIFFSALLAAIQSGLVVGVLAAWRRLSSGKTVGTGSRSENRV